MSVLLIFLTWADHAQKALVMYVFALAQLRNDIEQANRTKPLSVSGVV